MEEIIDQRFIDLSGGGTYFAIPNSAKGHLYRTHAHSQFRLFFNHERLYQFLDSAKPFSECNFNDDYIILQMMQHEESQGTLVEFLKFGNLNGKFTDPTAFDLAPWVPMEKERPVDGQMVIVYKGQIAKSGEREFLGLSTGKYHAEDSFMNKGSESEVVFWKPLSPPEGFRFF